MKWVKIDGYDYEISETGIVKSCSIRRGTNGKPLTIWINCVSGYPSVSLYKNGKAKNFTIHRLLAMCFIDGYTDDCFIDHINCIRTDNRLENLRITNSRGNSLNRANKSQKSSNHYGISREGEYKDGTPRWRARIYINGKNTTIGSFKSELEAAQAYQKKLSELNGEVSR